MTTKSSRVTRRRTVKCSKLPLHRKSTKPRMAGSIAICRRWRCTRESRAPRFSKEVLCLISRATGCHHGKRRTAVAPFQRQSPNNNDLFQHRRANVEQFILKQGQVRASLSLAPGHRVSGASGSVRSASYAGNPNDVRAARRTMRQRRCASRADSRSADSPG